MFCSKLCSHQFCVWCLVFSGPSVPPQWWKSVGQESIVRLEDRASTCLPSIVAAENESDSKSLWPFFNETLPIVGLKKPCQGLFISWALNQSTKSYVRGIHTRTHTHTQTHSHAHQHTFISTHARTHSLSVIHSLTMLIHTRMYAHTLIHTHTHLLVPCHSFSQLCSMASDHLDLTCIVVAGLVPFSASLFLLRLPFISSLCNFPRERAKTTKQAQRLDASLRVCYCTE